MSDPKEYEYPKGTHKGIRCAYPTRIIAWYPRVFRVFSSVANSLTGLPNEPQPGISLHHEKERPQLCVSTGYMDDSTCDWSSEPTQARLGDVCTGNAPPVDTVASLVRCKRAVRAAEVNLAPALGRPCRRLTTEEERHVDRASIEIQLCRYGVENQLRWRCDGFVKPSEVRRRIQTKLQAIRLRGKSNVV